MRGRTRIINVDISDYKLKHPPTGSPNSGPGRRTPASLGRGEIDLSRRGDRGESKPVPLTKCLGLSPPGEKSTFETVHGPRSAERWIRSGRNFNCYTGEISRNRFNIFYIER